MPDAPKIPAGAGCISDMLRGRVVNKKISTASAGRLTGDLIRADLDITVVISIAATLEASVGSGSTAKGPVPMIVQEG